MSKTKGDVAEEKSCAYLISNGFTIIEKNFYAKKLGEIDIVALKDDVYHFCEVKSAQDYETAANNLSFSKLGKLKRSIEYYLQTKKINPSYVIDAIIVVDNQIEFLENITL